MKRSFIFLFLLLFFVADYAAADEVEDLLCNKSSSCKKFCKLQRKSTYSDLKPEDQEIMVKCINDIVAEINEKTPKPN